MDADFTIDVDPALSLVRIRMAGFFTEADVARFVEAQTRAHQRLRCAPNRHLTLNDLREIKIQSQDAVTRFGAVLADPAFHSRRLAFVVASTLARSQLRRALGSRPAGLFTDPLEAEAWLLDEDEGRQAA